MLLLLLTLVACGKDQTEPSGDDTAPQELLGCKNPDNWSYGSNETTCEGNCQDEVALICSTGFDTPQCRVSQGSLDFDTCDYPTGETGDGICDAAITGDCAQFIDANPS